MRRRSETSRATPRYRGAALVEIVIVLPICLFAVLALMQAALVYYAKSNLNYAAYEAARAGSVSHASQAAIHAAFQKALLPYYGGGRTPTELQRTAVNATRDLAESTVRVEILSPTQQSFSDYNSPALQTQLRVSEPAIPNVGLDELSCPRDVPGCRADPQTNSSGQTLSDANVLKLRITYGIPPQKQMPMVGPFYTWAMNKMGTGAADPFTQALIDMQRIPVVVHTVMRMQSEAIRNAAMVSAPGPGNNGTPADPGPPSAGTQPLPECPWWDPACVSCPDGKQSLNCQPELCTG